MRRAVVSVASNDHFRKGQLRLDASIMKYGDRAAHLGWGEIPPTWPTHADKPFAFKAYALQQIANNAAADVLLWCDSCMVAVRPLDPLWEKIERDGAVFFRNGFTNYEWTADSAYWDLFNEELRGFPPETTSISRTNDMEILRGLNCTVPHVVGGCFGLSLRTERGQAILKEFYRLASGTRAFCGPWTNTAETPCGPPDVLGHRHDQSALSVIAWRRGVELTDCPEFFSYGKPETATDERIVIVADGSY